MDIPIIGQILQIENFEEAGPSSGSVPLPVFIGESSDDNLEESAPTWNELPDIVIANIASFMLPWDRAKMALTCRNWNRVVMSSPHLWRTAEMRFRGNFKDIDHVIYTRSVGRYLKKLYIHGGVRLGRRASRFQRTFTAMLQNLYRQGPVQLKELSVTELQFQHQFRSHRGDNARKGVLRSLRRFLRMQTRLERLDLSYAALNFNEGISLVQAASYRSYAKLKYLYLDDMFQRDAQVNFSADFANAMGHFKTLVDLTLNYGCVTALLLKRLGENCNMTLEFIHIRTHRCDSFQHMVDVSAWHGIREAIPRLRVKFTLNGILRTNDIQRLLATSIPLQSVSIYGHNDDDFHPDRTVKHLARHYRDTLQKVIVDVGPVYRAFTRGLIALVIECTSLRYLELHGHVQWPTLREIFEHIDETFLKKNLKPSLTNLRIVITSIGQEQPEAEMLVMEEFRPRFQRQDLDYEVVVDPIYPIPLLAPNPELMNVFW